MKIYNDRASFYQWDLNQKITSADLAIGDEVHFTNLTTPQALVVKAYPLDSGEVVADVPNILLTSAIPIIAYRYVKNGEAEHTRNDYEFDVLSRPKPSDYVYTETEIHDIESAVNKALQDAKESGAFEGKPGTPGKDGKDGADGKDGLSAYEIAVKNGFEGTEAEWLALIATQDWARKNFLPICTYDSADGSEAVVMLTPEGKTKLVMISNGNKPDAIVKRESDGDIIGPAAFHGYKSNDKNERALAPKYYVDQLVDEKVGDISSALDAILTKAQNLITGGNA